MRANLARTIKQGAASRIVTMDQAGDSASDIATTLELNADLVAGFIKGLKKVKARAKTSRTASPAPATTDD
jgi:hypothetical protein